MKLLTFLSDQKPSPGSFGAESTYRFSNFARTRKIPQYTRFFAHRNEEFKFRILAVGSDKTGCGFMQVFEVREDMVATLYAQRSPACIAWRITVHRKTMLHKS
jgi:hypothetical protein